MTIIDRLLPRPIDNTYRGHKAALWLFGVLVLMKSGMSLGTIFNGYVTATRADGLPLDTYPAAAARTIVALFAAWGFGHLVLCLLCILVLVRYRALIPFMYLLILTEHLGRRLIFQILPIARVGNPPAFVINLSIVIVMIIGLLLSLRRSKETP